MGLTEAGQHAKADAVLADRGAAFVQNVEFDRKRARLISDRDWAGLAAYMSGPQFAPPAAFSETYALIAETAEALASKTIDRSYFRERWKEVVHRHPHHRFIAIEYLGYLGDIEGMREHAITIIESRERWQYVGTLFAPSARLLRSDISFVSIMQKAGLWTYWSETGRWPDFCQEKDLPYNCRAEAAKLAAPL